MKVGIGSDRSGYIFFLSSVRENIQSTHWFSEGDTILVFLTCSLPSAPRKPSAECCPWPLAVIKQGKWWLVQLSQVSMKYLRHDRLGCLGMLGGMNSSRGGASFLGTYFVFLCQLDFNLPVPRVCSLVPFQLDPSYPIQCTENEI